MSQDGTEAGQNPVEQAVNDPTHDNDAISSLQRYRERQRGSPSSAQDTNPGDEGTSHSEPQQREPAIPRERFDQVNDQKNQYQQQLQQLQQQITAQQQGFGQSPTGLQPGQQFPYGQPTGPQQHVQPGQQLGATGMVHQQPQQQQQQPQVNFSDPDVQEKWKKKLRDDPINGMREFVSTVLQAEGTPLLQQFQQQILSQITPLQQQALSSAITSYSQRRSQQDPSFQQVAPVFGQVVQEAVRRNPQLSLNEQSLSVIEHIARLQAQQQPQMGAPMGQFQVPAPQPQQAQQQVPFSESPQGRAPQNATQAPQREITPYERRIARGFGMTDEEYLKGAEELG